MGTWHPHPGETRREEGGRAWGAAAARRSREYPGPCSSQVWPQGGAPSPLAVSPEAERESLEIPGRSWVPGSLCVGHGGEGDVADWIWG